MRTKPGPFPAYAIYAPDGTLLGYIVGLLHIGDGVRLLTPGSLFRSLHEWCSTTITEVDLSEIERVPFINDLQGPPLTQVADAELCRDAERACSRAGLDYELVSVLPGLVLWLLLTRCIWHEPGTMDEAVHLLARHEGHETLGLETFDDQRGVLERLPAHELVVSIRRVVALWLRGERARRAFRREVMHLYENGRVGELLQLEELRALMPTSATVLLDERDRRWVEQLATILPGRRSFVAVGLGHLPGLVHGLRDRGFAMVPVLSPGPGEHRVPDAVRPARSWVEEIEWQAGAMLGGAPIVSALCTVGAQDTRTPVFLSDGNLARKHQHGVPAPNLLVYAAEPPYRPLEFEDSLTRVTIQERRELRAGGREVRLTRLRCEDKPGSKQVLGAREVVVAQLFGSGWAFLQPVEEQGWRPAVVVAMRPEGADGATDRWEDGWVKELSNSVVGAGDELHLVTDQRGLVPPTRRYRHGRRSPISVTKLARLSRRWGRSRRGLRGATIFRLAPIDDLRQHP